MSEPAAPPPSQPPDDEEDERHRNFVNLIAVAFVLALAIAVIWVFKSLDDHRQTENCIASGRHDCIELDPNATGR